MCRRDQRVTTDLRRLADQHEPFTATRIGQSDDGMAVFRVGSHGDPLGHRQRDHLACQLGKPLGAAGDRNETLVIDANDIAGVVPPILRRCQSTRLLRAKITRHHVRSTQQQASSFGDSGDGF